MQPAVRITDMHVCPMVNPGPVPHVGGPVVKGQPTVLVLKLPMARVGDMCTCVGPPDTIVSGAANVLVGGIPAARLGDATSHGGVIVAGAPTVFITASGGGGGGAGGGGAGAGASGGPAAGAGAALAGAVGGATAGAPLPMTADYGASGGVPSADRPCMKKAAKAGAAFVRVK